MVSGNPSNNVDFDPTGATLVDEPKSSGFDTTGAEEVTAPTTGPKEAPGLFHIIGELLTSSDARKKFGAGLAKLPASAASHYDQSVEDAFKPSASQPVIPRVEGSPDSTGLQVAAAGANTVNSVTNSALTPGFASMLNPLALAYALPHFARQAGTTSGEFLNTLEDKSASIQSKVESGANAALSIAGAVAPVAGHFIGAKGLVAKGEPITEFKPVAEVKPVEQLARAAEDLTPEAKLDSQLPSAQPEPRAANPSPVSATPTPEATPSPQAPETVATAAVKLADGKVVTGKTHGQIIADLPAESDLTGADDGFVTSTGRYVTREEGMKIAKESAQVDNSNLGPDRLYAEHLDKGQSRPPIKAGETPLEVARNVSDLGAEDFQKWAGEQPNGITAEAHKAGIAAIGDEKAIAELKQHEEAAKTAANDAVDRFAQGDEKAGDESSALATKRQFFREAVEAAENKGGAARDANVQAAHGTNEGELIPTSEVPFNLAGEAQKETKSAVKLAEEKAQRDADLAAQDAAQTKMFEPEPEMTDADFARFQNDEREGALEGSYENEHSLLDWIKGKLPHPETAAEGGEKLSGELKGLEDFFSKEVNVSKQNEGDAARAGKGPRKGYSTINKSGANSFFAKKGQYVSVDDVAQAAREAGFNFKTPAEMLTAVDDALRGNDIYSVRGSTEESAGALNEDAGKFHAVAPGTAHIGQAIQRASGALSDLTDAAKRVVKEVRDVPEFTPFKQSINEWAGSRELNSMAVREMAEKIQKEVPERQAREAVTNYIQADGNTELLKYWRDNTTKAKLKDAYNRALNLTPEQKAVADNIREFYADKLDQAQQWGIIDEGIPNYVNQIWKEQLIGTPPQTSPFGGRLAQSFRSAKARTFENFFEGEQAGFKPATKDISELTAVYADGLNKAIATRKLIKDLTKKTASDGRPLAAPIGSAAVLDEGNPQTDPLFVKPNAKGDFSDYRPLDNPALYKWKWVGESDGNPVFLQGQLGLHPEIYQHMKDMLGRSAIREWYDKPGGAMKGVLKGAVKGVDQAGSVFKAMSLGFLSPFHQVQEATHAIGHKINPFTNLPDLQATDPVIQRAVTHGLTLAGERDAVQHFGEGLGEGGHNNPLYKLPVVGKWAQDYSTWLFRDYIPQLKLKTFQAIEERNTARYAEELKSGKVTKDQISYLSALQTNNAYGHLNYSDIGRNPTMQHILQLTLLAPDFLEARGRFTGQAAQGLVSKVGREQLAAMATLAATFYVTARVLNKTLDDDYHWNHPFSVIHGDREYAMRSVPEDIYRLFKDSRAFINNRLSPLVGRGALEFVTGRNWRGEKVGYTQEFHDLATRWIPINLQGTPGAKLLAGSEKNSPISAWEQFVSSAGLQIKRVSPINDIYQLAADWKDATGKPKDTGTYPVSKYQQLRYALEDGNQDKARAEFQKLIKDTPPAKIVQGFHQSLLRPFTGSTVDEVNFIKSLGPKDQQAVKNAYALRGTMWTDFLRAIRSGRGTKSSSPEPVTNFVPAGDSTPDTE